MRVMADRTCGRHMAGALALMLLAACSQGSEQPGDRAETAPAAATPGESALPSPEVAQSDVQDVQTGGPRATTLCGAEERQLFSCTVRGGKLVSVCMAADPNGAFAQYRFGKPGATELVWPDNRREDAIAWASMPYSGGGEAQLSFAKGDVRYVVYSKIVRTNFAAGEPNNPAITDGVAVLRAGKLVSNLRCDESGAVKSIDTDTAEKHLEKADDLFTYDID